MSPLSRNIFSPAVLHNLRRRMMSTNSSPSEYCVNMVKTHDYENFLCTLLLSKIARNAAFAIRAFNVEVARVADQTYELHIAKMRMQFWKDTLNNIYSSKIPNHPVAQELARIIQRHNLPQRQFSKLVLARSKILSQFSFDNTNQMETYVEETVSPVYYLILEASGIKNIQADHVASHLGKAQGIVNLLRSLPYNLNRRQLLLPQDILAKHSASQEDFLRQKNTEGVKKVIFDLASLAYLHIKKARSLRRDLPREVMPIFLPAIPISAYLEDLRDMDFYIFSPIIQERKPTLGLTLFWRKLLGIY